MYINIGNRREVLWDDYLIDSNGTTAKLTLNKPQKKEFVYRFDKPWEETINYPQMIKLGDEYYMYYTAVWHSDDALEPAANDFNKEVFPVRKGICLMKGKDPLKLERINAGLFEVNGSFDNNIILIQNRVGDFEEEFDNLFVFVDDNPDCPAEQKIKAIGQMRNHAKIFPGFRELWSFVSADGIHFERYKKISGGDDMHAGLFDSHNIVFYDTEAKVYKAFIRGLHLDWGIAKEAQETGYMTKAMEKDLAGFGIRDIRYMESKDFATWSVPKRLTYSDNYDYQLYTNHVQKYERAPHMYIGLPTRYTERKEWTTNFEQIGGEVNVSNRRERYRQSPRYGLAVTDNIFMCSRDGLKWNRFHDSLIGGGPEDSYNWAYGDAYMLYNVLESCDGYPGREAVYTLLAKGCDEMGNPALIRHDIRKDGFASYHSDFEVSTLITKPIIFEGTELSINFATSPAGFVYVDILDEWDRPIDGYRSIEHFGNTLDRTVCFPDGRDLSKLSGKPIKLKFTMRSADIYSFIFR